MGKLHDLLETHGQLSLTLTAANKEERRRVEIATVVMSDDTNERAFAHPGLCLTILPHRHRPEREIWTRVNGPVTLTVQPTADSKGLFYGVPYGAKARLILIYLQTEAVKTNSRRIELGKSMRDWLRNMGVGIGGPNLSEVRRQAKKIERSLLTFTFEDKTSSTSWQDTIIRGSFASSADNEILFVDLSESFFKAIQEHPVPLSEAAIRALGERCAALDIYLWLAYRLHALEQPTLISWRSLHGQFGAATKLVKHFKPRFARDFEAALAAYPTARAEVAENGVRLHPSPPPLGRGRLKLI